MGKVEALRALAERIRLPAMPRSVARISTMLADRECGPQEIGRVVAEDPGLTVRVLAIANSSVYGVAQPVLSAEQAATVIGVRGLRNVVVQAALSRRYERLSGRAGLDLQACWEHAAQTARLAQMLGTAARSGCPLAPDEYYTCGLLHDVGSMVLLDSLGEEYAELMHRARGQGRPLHLVEAEELGFSHVEIGALITRVWRLPREAARAIAFHHGPIEQVLASPSVAAVAIADQLVYRAAQPDLGPAIGQLSRIARQVLDVTPRAFERVLAASRGELEASLLQA